MAGRGRRLVREPRGRGPDRRAMSGPAPLVFPLAGLLAEPAGTERRYELHGATIQLPGDLRLTEPIDGNVRITRTNRGVLVDARIATAIAGTCARCLRDIEVPS